jgi:hypothetical protein
MHLIETMFVPKLPFPFTVGLPAILLTSGSSLFKHFLTCLWHAINSKVFEVEIYTSKVQPLQPVPVRTKVAE